MEVVGDETVDSLFITQTQLIAETTLIINIKYDIIFTQTGRSKLANSQTL